MTLQELKTKAKAQNMDFSDFLYYYTKELQQKYDFWNEKSYKHIRGAKIRARNLLSELRDIEEIQIEL